MKIALKNVASLAMSLLALMACESKKETAIKKPNVVLFVVDDLGWTDAATFGSDLYQTPNVDRLAEDGVKFTDAYAACTVCSPSRASLMTGKYPATINCTDWITGHKKPFAKMAIPEWTMYMDPKEYTLAEALKDEGYNTIHLGKWHLGETENYWPENQGFDQNIAGHSAGSPKSHGGGGYFSPYQNPRLEDGPEGEYLTERLAAEASAYIQASATSEKPFYMNLWLYNVHTPLQAKEDKIRKYEAIANDSLHHSNPVYAAMVEHMDDAVGQVVDQLKATGIYDNTIFIFFSDNGGLRKNFKKTQSVTDNYPLRSGKGDIYEGGVRVPLVISWPDGIEGGRISKTIAISPDIYPTVLSLIKSQNTEALKNIDGKDLSSTLLSNQDQDRGAVYWHYPHYHLEGAKPYSAVRKGNWKLIQVFEEEQLQLYNLKEDIGETINKVDEQPDITKELFQMLNQWREKVGAQLPTANPNYDPVHEEKWLFKKSAIVTPEDLEALKSKTKESHIGH
ncbi:sulfatase [Reichenbachiella versicolor]|uniref:sulfatase n=1 Tax=Reichenbachiella versicolor TaxID=1821036 RepID=UPI000D6E5081|nr:sulfatase [Reichenbachiella versicolor]